ncbi:saccharopine dehydrogenase NADP-binding domain-containing protein [Dyella humicola]|uniref:saccharopine dehydrogenase NADP-binding domain-containing protein n=1 Tax=Dyella humicola TaxID=2992126 RepID=UPI002251BAF1|nr:saccharopine dehydrogenase NADP-binding domain-containing protein [Dyella humicola]
MVRNNSAVAVYGATGHTGTFVIAELLRRGIPVVAVGRDVSRVPAGVTSRIAAIDDAAALDRAFADCSVVINCAGPFLDTAPPVVEAALRAGCAYLDVTAEQASALSTFERYDERARAAGIAVIPAAGFYGGLADLLASALAGDQPIDDMTVAIALDHWWPTKGTRLTGERNRVPRVVLENGGLVPMAIGGTKTAWTFDAPHGVQEMEEMPFSEIITISRHLDVRNLRAYLNAASLGEIRDAATPQPAAIDTLGRSAQQFVMEVLARDSTGTRRAVAHGQDIYAVTAPLVVEAAARMLQPSFDRIGTLTLGQAFDAKEFLRAFEPEHLMFALHAL